MVAANEVPHATFVGIELRPNLVRMAKRIATRLAIQNVRFLAGDALELDWAHFDAFYFYNPFAEQRRRSGFAIDQTLAVGPTQFARCLKGVQQRLEAARVGTRVVAYHGFGAPPPPGYDLAEQSLIGSDRVALWVKTAASTGSRLRDKRA